MNGFHLRIREGCKRGLCCTLNFHRSCAIELERRACKLVHQGGNFFHAARGTRQRIKRLKATQCKENINSLIHIFARREDMALNEPLSNHADSSPPQFVSCAYHLLKIRVERC